MPSSFNIYYFFDRNGAGETVHAFPEGLRVRTYFLVCARLLGVRVSKLRLHHLGIR